MRVSILGFGAMRLPTHEDGTCDVERSIPLLRKGIDLGINYIDTAHVYIKGTSEVTVGQAIKDYEREKLHLVTKIPVHKPEEADPATWRQRLEESLERFDTSYVDVLLFHNLYWDEYEEYVAPDGTLLDEARKAQDEGLVRHVGFSSHDTPERIMQLVDTGEFEAMLVQYNYLYRHNEPAIEHAHENGLGVAIMGPLAGGRLATPQGVVVDDEGVLEMKTPEVGLRFVWSNPHVSVALSGMNEMSQIEENVAAADQPVEMSAAEVAEIHRLVDKQQEMANLYCTGCGYCMPCPNEVNIPENFRYLNWYRVWGMEEEAKKAYAKLSEEGTWTSWLGRIEGRKAEACVECGQCEPKCPQNIPIIEQLKEVAETLG
jgi:hypothetical protein